MSIKEGKRGQLTIFIIIAILIIALALLIYFLYPKMISKGGLQTSNPYTYMDTCIKEKIEETIQIVSLQGGNYIVTSQNQGYFYRGEYVRFLCYSNEDFQPCVNQEPFLTEHVESEIRDAISSDLEKCLDSMVESFEKKGYDVDLEKGVPEVQILPEMVYTKFNCKLTLVKGGESQKYEDFGIKTNSNLYEMLEVVKNIIIWEMNVGDSIPEAYMELNPYLKVEKKRKENEIKLYMITDRNTGEVFRFATRSFAAPVGFAS
jgi:hypothetical protein